MVSKKASADDTAKKTAKPATVKKETKPATVKTTGKKTAGAAVMTAGADKNEADANKTAKTATKNVKAKAAPAKTTAKATATKAASKAQKTVPAAENHDIISEVLEIKSRNEAKKSAKQAAVKNADKKTTVTADSSAPEEKGRKAAAGNSKRAEVKENAKIAEAKKFMAMKESALTDGETDESNGEELCDGTFCAWGRAYKNMFNFKGRTSRFEFWSFMLINMIMLFALECSLVLAEPVSPWVSIVLVVFYILQLFTYLSLCVRRLHDAGYRAWRGFYCPFLINWIAAGAFSVAGMAYYTQYIGDVSGEIFQMTTGDSIAMILFAAGTFVTFLLSAYYCIKIFIVTSFFEEEHAANEYGAVSFCDEEHKGKSLRYAAVYLLLVLIGYFVYFTMIFASVLYAGGAAYGF